jgi:16S rRNA (guanine(1405)-N(7))-methyltransferase
MDAKETLEELVNAVKANPKYRSIETSLVRSIGQTELAHRENFKEAVKATRNKIHQIGGAYQEGGMDYPRCLAELDDLPASLTNPALRDFCRQMMIQHASTRERLPFLEHFYIETLESLGPVHSILDLACGLNPFALPWMPLAPGARYYAYDIYQDMIDLIRHFFYHINQNGEVDVANLVNRVPAHPVQLALLLKTLPCLEQLDKNISQYLLTAIQAEHLLISYPVHSLGGQSKGMLVNYENHFRSIADGKHWSIRRFQYASELVFLISR